MTGPYRRAALGWLLGAGLLVAASEAERLRRHVVQPGLCLGSVMLLRGLACPTPSQTAAPPL